MARNAVPRRTSDAPAPRTPRSPQRRASSLPRLGPIQLTPFRAVIAIAFLGSGVYIAWAILRVKESSVQVPMLSSGFAILGLSCAAIALGGAINMWRAASVGRSGRALALAIVGGAFGMAAIGCFTLTVILALVWKS